MIKKPVISLLASALMATAAHAGTCDTYVGQTVAPKTFDQAILSINAPAQKGEFETTAAYRARIQGAGGTGPLIISKRMEDPKYLEYDADRGAFKVISYLFDNSNFSTWDALHSSGMDVHPSRNLDVQISLSKVATGSYMAQNGFGARTRITKFTHVLKGIFERSAAYSEDLFAAPDETLGYLPMDAAKAPAFRQTAKIAFVVEPKAPYVVRATFRESEPTISYPEDVTVNSTILIAHFQCALIMTSGNVVVGAYDTL